MEQVSIRQRIAPLLHPNEVCVLLGVRIIVVYNVCSTVQVDKKLGFGRTLCAFRWRVVGRGKPRFLAITAKGVRIAAAACRRGALAGKTLLRCCVGIATLESRTDLGGLTRSFQQGASQALQLAARAPLRARAPCKMTFARS